MNIHIIDDDQDDQRLLKYHISKTRYIGENLTMLDTIPEEETSADLVLLDIHLAGTNGLETIYRAQAAYVDVPLVVVSGVTDQHFLEKCIELGAQDYLDKNLMTPYLLEKTIYTSIKRFELQKNLEHQAKYDTLTNVMNREAVLHRLEEQLYVCQQNMISLGIVFIDIDGFKGINDKFGHDVGDRVLKYFAEKLQDLSSPFTDVGRLGGDEFILIISEIETHDTLLKAHEILDSLSLKFQEQELIIPVHFSYGTVSSTDKNLALKDLLKQADQSMYEMKNRS